MYRCRENINVGGRLKMLLSTTQHEIYLLDLPAISLPGNPQPQALNKASAVIDRPGTSPPFPCHGIAACPGNPKP